MNPKLVPKLVIFIVGAAAVVLLVWHDGLASAEGIREASAVNLVEQASTVTRPLKTHPLNPRYFTDGSGKVTYLTGSHTHRNFQDSLGRTSNFDYLTYLEFLQRYNHNFIRLWTWEDLRNDPLPYLRMGPGMALDDNPKFDLTQWNQAYFDRLRSRVLTAWDRGIYVSIMLFQGWSLEDKMPGREVWSKHPFNKVNNINGVDGDPNGDGQGIELHTLQNQAITSLQEAYIRKVIDTVNDLGNVLYEVSNETNGSQDNTQWQYHIINYIKRYEASKSKQHPVGMTVEWPDGNNAELFASPADWISPNHTSTEPYQDNPLPADGTKVILSDTDHLWGAGGNQAWVWKSFVRGLQPIFMDVAPPWGTWSIPDAEAIRKAMGYTKSYALRMNLAQMYPRPDLCSTTFCLANPGREYLVYLPSSEPLLPNTVTIDLSSVSEPLAVEWFDPSKEVTIPAQTIKGGTHEFTAPFIGDAVLYIFSLKATAMQPCPADADSAQPINSRGHR